MKIISLLFLALTSVFAQSAQLPSISPASATVNYDKAVDTLVSLPLLTLSGGANPFSYSVHVPADYSTVVLYSPMVGFLLPGSTSAVRLAINAQHLNVGTYNIPVNFVQFSPNSPNWAVSFGLTLNVTDSGTHALPSANDRQIPHIAAGGQWRTKIRLFNTSIMNIVSEIRFYNNLGLPDTFTVNNVILGYSVVSVPARGYVDIMLTNSTGLKTGTAMIRPLSGPAPDVILSYIDNSTGFESAAEVKAPSRNILTIPFNNTNHNSTGIVISNALNFNQEVTVEFYNNQGVNIATQNFGTIKIALPGNGQFYSTVSELWPFTEGQSGSVRITGTQPALFGFGVQFDLGRGVFYTQPAF
jgi:hypothetical protein